MTWAVCRRDDDEVTRTFDTEPEARAFINERTMPWEFYTHDLSGRRSVTVTITVDEEAWDEALASEGSNLPDDWDWLFNDVHQAIVNAELDGYLTAYTGQTYGKVVVTREPRIEDI